MSRSGEAIWAAYADVDSALPCPNCAADPGVWCSRPDGRVRRVPCVARPRVSEASPAQCADDAPDPPVDFGEPRHQREVER
ncbi:hypothetical protein A5649_13480 [Mycolicibacter heraklionensis]|uniref:Uncharacterized protein n=1 Tax=Mycolicibacter heraklionensis TaxID=512402 RepID=A0AA91IZV5_9MYCO|nr:hypothetical protein [Mycolicibacter heraklionensis]OBK89457.1 hypothetical protein A5649_13480 [Mycolicibacter heraklionensis]